MKNIFRLFSRCNSGVALIEFGIVLPFLMLMLLGMVETARFAILLQKLDKTTDAMADYVTQGTTVSTADLDVYAQAASDIMAPFPFSGTIIFSSVVDGLTAPPCQSTQPSCISWRYTPIGGAASQIGNVGGPFRTGNYTLQANQSAIVVEIYYNYTPMLDVTAHFVTSLAPQTLYRTAIYKPRYGNVLTQLQ